MSGPDFTDYEEMSVLFYEENDRDPTPEELEMFICDRMAYAADFAMDWARDQESGA